MEGGGQKWPLKWSSPHEQSDGIGLGHSGTGFSGP